MSTPPPSTLFAVACHPNADRTRGTPRAAAYLENGVVSVVGCVVCGYVVERAPCREGDARFQTIFSDECTVLHGEKRKTNMKNGRFNYIRV